MCVLSVIFIVFENVLNKKIDQSYVYHNLTHTKSVVKKTKELIEGLEIEEAEANKLIIAAWFHDTGYVNGIEGHEEESVKIATEFLKNHTISEEDINTINELILVTKVGKKPKNLLEQVICDADCSSSAYKFSSTVKVKSASKLSSNPSPSASVPAGVYSGVPSLSLSQASITSVIPSLSLSASV